MGSVGRPMDEARTKQIRQAALDLLAEEGYDRLTIEAVAARAGVGKPTVYRRWSSRADLVVDAVGGLSTVVPTPDTGSVEGDLRIVLSQIRPKEGRRLQVMRGLISALPRNPDLAALFREHVVEPRIDVLRTVFTRGIDRGEVPEGTDPDLLAAVIPSMFGFRALFAGRTVDADFAEAVLCQIVLPLLTSSRRPSKESA